MQEMYEAVGCTSETARLLAGAAGRAGYGVMVRGKGDDLTVTVFAPADGDGPLPWGMEGHDLSRILRGIRDAQD